jgi:hypothetical protein
VVRLWKTKYPLAATKIREYAAGLPGNSRLEDSVSHRSTGVSGPGSRIFHGPKGQGQYLYLN